VFYHQHEAFFYRIVQARLRRTFFILRVLRRQCR